MTTPRDAIGLSDRLRFDAARCELHFSKGVASNIEEAATALDALSAENEHMADTIIKLNEYLTDANARTEQAEAMVKELEDHNRRLGQGGAERYWENRYRDEAAATARAEQERDKLQGMLLLCGELGGIGKDETPVAYLRRLIDGLIDAGRERDEALERLKPFAYAAESLDESHLDRMDLWESPSGLEITAGHLRAARDLVRRLAAGTGDF